MIPYQRNPIPFILRQNVSKYKTLDTRYSQMEHELDLQVWHMCLLLRLVDFPLFIPD